MIRMTGPDCVVMCNLINIHTHTHTYTGPDCVVMCNLINTHTHTPPEDQCEWHRMTRMTGPDCVVRCNLINTHTHTHAQVRFVQVERVCPLYRV